MKYDKSERCRAESLGYNCVRLWKDTHSFHLSDHGEWWMRFPQHEDEWRDPMSFPPSGYTLLTDSMLPRMAVSTE